VRPITRAQIQGTGKPARAEEGSKHASPIPAHSPQFALRRWSLRGRHGIARAIYMFLDPTDWLGGASAAL
jgi:hypothetical protein